MSADDHKHDTIRMSRLAQEKKCAIMSADQLKYELESLKAVLTNVTDEHSDRRETIESLIARLDIVRSFMVDKIEDENAPF